MADERVVIKIEVKSDDKAIDRTRRKLERLAGSRDRDRKSEGLASRSRTEKLKKEFKKSGDEFDKVSRLYKKRFDSYDHMIKNTGMGMMKFLSASAKAVTVSMAAMGAAMVAIHVAFAAGQLIMKAYNGVMRMAAAGMAGLVIAAGTVAAALREQQAAMYAFGGGGQAKEFGSALNQTRMQMRALTTDASLAAVGVENLTAAYAEVVKTGGKFNAGSQASLKGLMDFASAGMDMKEGTKQAGALIATLQDTKKSYADVVSSGKKFSPQLKKALEEYEKGKGNKKTKEGLTSAIKSGELAKLGGVEGQFSAVSGTLINTLKGQFNLLRGQFADFGQSFLAPMKKEAIEVFAIVSRAMQRISGQVADFGSGGFIDKISVVVDKIANFMVRTMRDFLPGSMGMFQKIGDWWDKFTNGWNKVLNVLRPFIQGAKVFEGILKNAWLPVWTQIKENMYSFNDQLIANRPAIEEFGSNIGNLLAKVMEYFHEARKLFFQALPFINRVVKGFTSLIELFTSFLGGFAKLTGGMGSMGGVGALMGMVSMARGMKNTKGYFTNGQSSSGIREVANMNVKSGTVIVNGREVAKYGPKDGGSGSSGIVKRSDSIRTGPLMHTGPFKSPPGTSRGSSSSDGLASSGRGKFVKTAFGGSGKAGMGPNGGTLITSGPNKGQEILTQRVRGKQVEYLFGGRGTGASNYSNKNLNNEDFRSGVSVGAGERMKGNRKIVDATGRIITRRENMARSIGEGQRYGAAGFGSDGRPKTMLDKMMGRNTGASGFVGRAADKYRNKLVANSKYLGPDGPPINPTTGKPFGKGTKTYKAWELTSNRAYGPGTANPDSIYGRTKIRYQNSSFYNNWLSPTSNITGGGPKQLGKYNPGRLVQSAKLGAGNARKSRLGGMVLGNEERKGFKGSAMAGMGVGMGLGMLGSSGMVSEEAQGFLSAGAAVGMMNPLAGLAIGLGGTALTAKTGYGGMTAGAGAGATIGSMIAPGFGTAAGAIIGAAVGGLMGRANRIKDEKSKSRKAFEGAFDQIFTNNMGLIQKSMIEGGGVGKSAIVQSTKAGGRMANEQDAILNMYRSGKSSTEIIAALKKDKQKYGLDNKQIEAMETQPGQITGVMDKLSNKQKAQTHLTDIYANRLAELTKLTGKSEQEIETMAMSMGVNLYDATVDFNEVVKNLGVSVSKTREQLRGMQMDVALQGLDVFAKSMANLDAPKIVDEQARAFRDMSDAAGGKISDGEFAEFIKDFAPNVLNNAGGGIQGLLEMRRQFGAGGTEFSREKDGVTSPFFGMEQLFTNSAGGQKFQQYLNEGINKGTALAGGQVNAKLFESESSNKFLMDADKFSSAVQKLDPNMQKQLMSDIENNTLFANSDMTKFGQQDFAKLMQGYGINASDLGLRDATDKDGLNISLDKLPEELKTTYGEIIKMFGDFFDTQNGTQPQWMTTKFIKFIAEHSDTSSPRGRGIGDTTSSRLSQTMGRHAQMDGMLTGNRTVTSSYRTTGLGSMNSDHVTGRAYDLVGQNLGAYQRMATANGGFAEFHGSNASRHLHVVPRLSAFGDTGSVSSKIAAAPASSAAPSQSSSGVTISQVIYGGQNSSPEQIADVAVRKMKLALENERQRR